jgi:hypothetical protein
MLYALVTPAGDIVEYRPYAKEPEGVSVAPNKPRLLPVVEVRANFNPATQVELEPVDTVEGSQVTRKIGVRAKSADELASLRAEKVTALQAEAGRRIGALYPPWKQMNMTARAVMLIDLRDTRELTPDETAEQDELRAAWAVIDAIRARSNDLEESIPQGAAGLFAFNPLVGWD